MQTSTLASPTKRCWSLENGSPAIYTLYVPCLSPRRLVLAGRQLGQVHEGGIRSLTLRSRFQAATCHLAVCQNMVLALPAGAQVAPAARHLPPWRLPPAVPIMRLPVTVISAAAQHLNSNGGLCIMRQKAADLLLNTSAFCLPIACREVLPACLAIL